jgi:hypothetical protein
MTDKKAAGGLPFVGNMTDGIDFVRKMWGVTGLPALPGMPSTAGITQFAQGLPGALPSMITPTLDVGELDKRIADLRAVEQWLALNANMLRATIQSLEVQRNTIATLKSFGGSMLASVTRGGGAHEATPGEAYLRHAEERGVARRQATAAASAAAAMVPPVSMPAPAAPTKRAAPRTRGKAAKKSAESAAAAMPLNPAAWWGALQDQFVRAAAAAAAAEPPKAAKRAAPITAAPPRTPTRRARKRAQG